MSPGCAARNPRVRRAGDDGTIRHRGSDDPAKAPAIELGAELKVIRILIFKNNVGHLGITLHINTQSGTRVDQINSGDAGIRPIG